jgi:hypothetical protein
MHAKKRQACTHNISKLNFTLYGAQTFHSLTNYQLTDFNLDQSAHHTKEG